MTLIIFVLAGVYPTLRIIFNLATYNVYTVLVYIYTPYSENMSKFSLSKLIHFISGGGGGCIRLVISAVSCKWRALVQHTYYRCV